jgi:hypothetical protein
MILQGARRPWQNANRYKGVLSAHGVLVAGRRPGARGLAALAEGARYIKGATALPRDTLLDMQSTRMQADSSSAAQFKMQQHFGLYGGEVVGADEDELPSCAYANRTSMHHYLAMTGEQNSYSFLVYIIFDTALVFCAYG